ncbi:MAG: twin-arginine translocase TatA/TatE family subunit [Planctomycetota bacterium]
MPLLALFGPTELWIILGVVVLLFGASKLPQLARSAGSSINQFKKGLKEGEDGVGAEDERKELP